MKKREKNIINKIFQKLYHPISILGQDIFGLSDQNDHRIKQLKEAVQYFHKGTQEGYSKQKPKVSKKAKNIPFEDQQKNDTKQGESDLVERIALDLDELDLNEAVAKVKEQIDCSVSFSI